MANSATITNGETLYVCGQCGAQRRRGDVVIVSEDEFMSIVRREDMVLPTHARRAHDCGFLGIRCREHPNAERLAANAVRRHLKRLVDSGEWC